MEDNDDAYRLRCRLVDSALQELVMADVSDIQGRLEEATKYREYAKDLKEKTNKEYPSLWEERVEAKKARDQEQLAIEARNNQA